MTEKELKIMKTKLTFGDRVRMAIANTSVNYHGDTMRKLRNLKALESTLYNESDLRGLSKAEKEFIRSNGYKCYIDIFNWPLNRNLRHYYFIANNLSSGKRQLYGHSKYQLLDPNGYYFPIVKGELNCNKWLILHSGCDDMPFHKSSYEVRARILFPISLI